MAETVTDPLEKAVLSGAIFAGPDPDGPERRANGERDSDNDKASSDNDHKSDDDDDLDSDYGIVPPSEMPSGGPVRTTKGQSHNTGVKGVLADYRNRNNPQWRQEGNAQSVENDLDESDGEQEAREAYRKQRIQEMMKMGSTERAETIGGPRYRAKFGQLREVGQEQFLKATEAQDGVMVIVHVYSPAVPACNVLDRHLISLAKSYPLVKFLKARSSELQFATGSEADVLPTLLVYRNGESVANLVAFHHELRPDGIDSDDEEGSISFSQKTVEDVLVRHGVLDRGSRSQGQRLDGHPSHAEAENEDDA